jgi:hypothetical protein
MTSQDAPDGSLISVTSQERSRRKNYNRKEVLLKTFNPFVTAAQSAGYGVQIDGIPVRIRPARTVEKQAPGELHSGRGITPAGAVENGSAGPLSFSETTP